MSLDFYQLDTKEYLFGLEDEQFHYLTEIFNEFRYRTGFVIDQYSDFKMSTENQVAIIKIVDDYIDKTNLNKNKSKTLTIIEFRTFLKHYSKRKFVLLLKGD